MEHAPLPGRTLTPSGPGLNDRTLEPFDLPLAAGEGYDGRIAERVDLSEANARGSLFTECRFDGCSLSEAQLGGTRFVDCRFTGIQANSVQLVKTAWTDVTMSESRVGGLVAYDAVWSRVTITGSKLDYVNLRGARLVDVAVIGGSIGEIDLGGATVRRMRFVGCRIGQLTVAQSKLTDVDISAAELSQVIGLDSLRGAVISEAQLYDLAPAFAAHLGITVAGRSDTH